jgi:peptide/nickel transport system ATP-binding protein
MSLLRVENLTVRYRRDLPPALEGVSFEVEAGHTLALVGESGSGKSTAALALLRLLPPGATVGGSVKLAGIELERMSEQELCRVRGREVGMIFQNPHAALDPLRPVGEQVSQSLRLHEGLSSAQARSRAVALLDEVGVPDPGRRARQYPHELSGGLKQRAMIAAAIACGPKLLIADEPTTALDVTIQAQVLGLLKRLQKERGLGLVLITHDPRVVAGMADSVVRLRGGRVEPAIAGPTVREGFGTTPRETPSLTVGPAKEPLLEVRGLAKRYGDTAALRGIDFTVGRGETLALVGESGSGKTTAGRCVLRLVEPDGGAVEFDGRDVRELWGAELLAYRRAAQIVFQDPLGALNPRMSVAATLAEPLYVHGIRGRSVDELLAMVGLGAELASRYPHQLSGGQRQRVVIARALSLEPALIVADEPTASLDASVREQVLALLAELQERLGVAYLFISHDLALVRRVAHRTAVMFQGQIVEQGPTEALFADPRHPYTQALLEAATGPIRYH